MEIEIKRVIAIFLAFCFLVSVTVTAVSAKNDKGQGLKVVNAETSRWAAMKNSNEGKQKTSMGEMLPAKARGPNEPGGLSFHADAGLSGWYPFFNRTYAFACLLGNF